MLLKIGSLLFIMLLTIHHVYYMHQRRDSLASSGMWAALSIALAAGASFGFVLGQTYQDYPFVTSLSVVLFAAVGYIAGKQVSAIASLNGLLAGTMGTMIGSYVGLALYPSNKGILIGDILFILIMFILQKMMDSLEDKRRKAKRAKKNANKIKISYTGTIILLSGVILLAGILVSQSNHIGIGQIGKPQSQKAVYDDENDLQEATIEVTSSGFIPKNTEFKAGTMIKATFDVKQNTGTGLTLISNDLGIHAELKKGENRFIMNNPQPGTYEIQLNPGGSICTFTVHE